MKSGREGDSLSRASGRSTAPSEAEKQEDTEFSRSPEEGTFAADSFEVRRRRRELVARALFAIITALLVLPVILILSYLVIRAWPVLTPGFVLENPADRMTAGGIWSPLIGTFFLAIVSLLIDAPIGILAAIYLNEYARDNWLTRLINLAVVNLAGVPSIVHGLFGVGAFVLFAGMG